MATGFLVLFSIAVLAGIGLYRQLTRIKLPPGTRPLPGPRGLPLIGRVHDIPSELSWLKFFEWSKTYGPIYKMEIFGTVHVWISSERIAHDLLSKRASIYSDRPVIPNLPNNRTSGDYLALMGRNALWRRQRKLCQNLMNASATAQLHDYPTIERNRFLYLMMRDPDNYIEWVEQFTSRTISRLGWGSPHPAHVLRKTTFGLLETISPSGALPNVISWLAHIPEVLSPWKKKEKARHQLEDRLLTSNVEYVKQMLDEGTSEPSFTRTFLQSKDSEKLTVDEVADVTHVVGIMAIAGALTIGSPIQTYMLAMCHYPQWQSRLRDEIDMVLGGRCPEWQDREKLPLLRAVVKEVIRWRPPVPTGIPHALEKDDVYDGYHIPAGATIHALEWGITRDENMYPDPETFNPDRWLLPQYPTYREPLTTYPNLNGYSQFGFGRRTCQGLPIVEQDLFLTMGGLAWGLNIRRRRDASGKEVPVHWDNYTPLLIAKPVKFQFDAVVWEPERRQKIAEMFADVTTQERVTEAMAGESLNDSDDESDHDFLVNVRDTPPQSPIQVRPAQQEEPPQSPELDVQPAQIDHKRRSGSISEPWHNALLMAQGPIIVR